jgi:tRNA1(Val) A37 N6-methylase TrmN6
MSTPYSDLSVSLTREISKIEKQNNGIYFTPPATILRNLEILKPYMKNVRRVLEPSCGSCEYITALCSQYSNLDITGIEFNETIFKSIQHISTEKTMLYNEDFLKRQNSRGYDLILGNPPYFVMKKQDVDPMFHDYFDGRPNIFILFIIKSLNLLNENGILSFVLPKNFLNCLYYDKTRKYINGNYQIIDILECADDYIETKQDTIIVIVQKVVISTIDNRPFCLNNGDYSIFGTPQTIVELNRLYQNSTTLNKLGFRVSVGTVVWNQCKNILTEDSSKTRLIYSSDIKNKKLVVQKYSNKDKKNYIDKKGGRTPLLILNRGYGVGKYKFEYCLIQPDCDYLIENHLICINYTKQIGVEELMELYGKIISSFDNDKTTSFINLYFGNNAINTTELGEIMPIYDIAQISHIPS